MDSLPDRSVTHVCKLNCHLCMEVQELIIAIDIELESVKLRNTLGRSVINYDIIFCAVPKEFLSIEYVVGTQWNSHLCNDERFE
jgi:hypothetical protein